MLGTADFADQTVRGKATTLTRLEEFSIQKPRVPLVASIADDLRLELDFTAAAAP